jgi:hypothetical protein
MSRYATGIEKPGMTRVIVADHQQRGSIFHKMTDLSPKFERYSVTETPDSDIPQKAPIADGSKRYHRV